MKGGSCIQVVGEITSWAGQGSCRYHKRWITSSHPRSHRITRGHTLPPLPVRSCQSCQTLGIIPLVYPMISLGYSGTVAYSAYRSHLSTGFNRVWVG